MGTTPFSNRAGSDAVGPAPHTGNPELERYCERELRQLWVKIQNGESQFLTLEPLNALPPRHYEGMIIFAIEGVAGPQRGMYEFRLGAWSKL